MIAFLARARLIASATAMLCAALPTMAAESITGKVVSVHDGDTLTALDASNVQHKIRLHGIDAPEIGQPFGAKSRDRLAGLAKGKTALFHIRDHDRPAAAQSEAQAARRGLWADAAPVPPWEWRATEKARRRPARR